MMSPKCSIVENDVDGASHTLSAHSSNVLGCTHSLWLFMLRFIDEDADGGSLLPNRGFSSNKPTHYLLDHGNFNRNWVNNHD